MLVTFRSAAVTVLSAGLGGALACSNATGPTTATRPVPATLVSVSPKGGATSVDPTSPIVVTFSHGMSGGIEMFVSLHEGDVTGPTVTCTAMWSTDRSTLTLMPSAPLNAGTQYAIHVGGGMKDANGNVIDMTQYGSTMGGQWATASMMNGGGMMGGGGPMRGMEMGAGWSGTNGMYGMVFSFTTS